MINVYAKNLLENYLKKKEGKKEGKKEEGFFDKMTMKILDNIQLTIKNIHFRLMAKKRKMNETFTILIFVYIYIYILLIAHCLCMKQNCYNIK